MRTSKPLETDGRSCVGSSSPPENWGRESVAATILSSQSKGERSRHKRCAFAEKQRKSQKNFERKADSAVRGQMMTQRKLYEAEAEVEPRNCEKSDFTPSGDQSRI